MPPQHKQSVLAGVLLIGAILASYHGVLTNGFVNWDDYDYIVNNAHVTAGLTLNGVGWAFRSMEQSNWHPLTWLSHMMDCQIYGLHAGGHHLTSLLLHVVNSLLVLLLFGRLTGSFRRSAIVAALFALHPLHAESVAWASERKDVLSTCFGLGALVAYSGYARRPAVGRYALVCGLFLLSLLAKPMLVTLPCVMLLLDFWPLRRRADWLALADKLPLLALSVLSSAITIVAQHQGGAMAHLEHLPVQARLTNAMMAYVFYLKKTLYPARLSFIYPLPQSWSLAQVAAGTVMLLSLSGLAVTVAMRAMRASRQPLPTPTTGPITIPIAITDTDRGLAPLVGWLWFLGTLLPVVGLLPVGLQFTADRYTYFPMIGLLAGAIFYPSDRWLAVLFAGSGRRTIAAVGLAAVLIGLSVQTHFMVGQWKNSLTLFQHGLDVTDDNPMAHYLVGCELDDAGRGAEALVHYREAVRIQPEFPAAQAKLGTSLARQGQVAEAMEHLLLALRQNPILQAAHLGIRAALQQAGRAGQPLQTQAGYLERAAAVLADAGSDREAIAYYRQAVKADPGRSRAHAGLGAALMGFDEYATAIFHLCAALREPPVGEERDPAAAANLTATQDLLRQALSQQEEVGDGKSRFPARLRERIDPIAARLILATSLRRSGRIAEALLQYRKVLALDPASVDAKAALAALR